MASQHPTVEIVAFDATDGGVPLGVPSPVSVLSAVWGKLAEWDGSEAAGWRRFYWGSCFCGERSPKFEDDELVDRWLVEHTAARHPDQIGALRERILRGGLRPRSRLDGPRSRRRRHGAPGLRPQPDPIR